MSGVLGDVVWVSVAASVLSVVGVSYDLGGVVRCAR